MNVTPELKQAIELYRAGDSNAYNAIYENSKDFIFNCIYKVVCTHNNAYDAACEIFNDTFMKIGSNIYQLQDVEKYYCWAGTVATRGCYDYLRENNYYQMETSFEEDVPDVDEIIPETVMQNREKQMIVKQIIDTKLSEMEKLCIVAYYYDELKISEIAQTLEIPENTVKTHLRRGKKKVKDAVSEVENTQGIRLHSFGPFMAVLLGAELESMGVAVAQGVTAVAASAVADVVGQSMAGQTADVMGQSMAGQAVGQSMAGQAAAMNTAGTVAASVAKAGGMAAKTKILIATISLVCVGTVGGTIAVISHNKNKDKGKDTGATTVAELPVEYTEDTEGILSTEEPGVENPDGETPNPETPSAGHTLDAARQPIDQDDLNTCWIEYGLEGLEEKDFSDVKYLDTFTFSQITDLPSIIRQYNYFWIKPFYEVSDGYATDNVEEVFNINPDWFPNGAEFGDNINSTMWGTIKCFKEKPEGEIEWNTHSDLEIEMRNETDTKVSWATCLQNNQFLLDDQYQSTRYVWDVLGIDGVIELVEEDSYKCDMDYKYTMSKVVEILGKPTTVYMMTDDYESQFGQAEHTLSYFMVYDRGDYLVVLQCGEGHGYGIDRAETNEEISKRISDYAKINVYTRETYTMSDVYKQTDKGTTHIYEY